MTRAAICLRSCFYERHDCLRHCFTRDRFDDFRKVGRPSIPISFDRDRCEPAVVFIAVPFEEEAQVEKRSRKKSSVLQ